MTADDMCSATGCDRKWIAKRLCLKHYKAARRPRRVPSTETFWTKYHLNPITGCWEWISPRDPQGYGKVQIEGKKWLAHRYSYTVLVGPIPEGFQVDHLCKNTSCINPRHLEAVTPHENNMRSESLASLRAKMTHCPRGHAFTPDNIYSRPDRKNGRMCRTCCQLREQQRERRTA